MCFHRSLSGYVCFHVSLAQPCISSLFTSPLWVISGSSSHQGLEWSSVQSNTWNPEAFPANILSILFAVAVNPQSNMVKAWWRTQRPITWVRDRKALLYQSKPALGADIQTFTSSFLEIWIKRKKIKNLRLVQKKENLDFMWCQHKNLHRLSDASTLLQLLADLSLTLDLWLNQNCCCNRRRARRNYKKNHKTLSGDQPKQNEETLNTSQTEPPDQTQRSSTLNFSESRV